MSEAFDKKRNSARRLREIADIIEKNERIVCKDFILPGHSEYDLTAKVEYNVAIDDGMEVLQMARVVGCVYNSITDGKYDWTNTVKAIETTLWEIRRNLRNDINEVMPGVLTEEQSRVWHKYKVQNVRFAAMLLDNAHMLRYYLEPLEMRDRAERAIFEEYGKMDSSDAVVILEHMLTWLEKGKMFPHETAETFSGKGTEYRDRYYALYCEALKAAIQAMKNQD